MEELVTQIKQYRLNWPSTCIDEPAVLADQLPKTTQKTERDKAAQIAHVQLQQLSSQARSLWRPTDGGVERVPDGGGEEESVFLVES